MEKEIVCGFCKNRLDCNCICFILNVCFRFDYYADSKDLAIEEEEDSELHTLKYFKDFCSKACATSFLLSSRDFNPNTFSSHKEKFPFCSLYKLEEK